MQMRLWWEVRQVSAHYWLSLMATSSSRELRRVISVLEIVATRELLSAGRVTVPL